MYIFDIQTIIDALTNSHAYADDEVAKIVRIIDQHLKTKPEYESCRLVRRIQFSKGEMTNAQVDSLAKRTALKEFNKIISDYWQVYALSDLKGIVRKDFELLILRLKYDANGKEIPRNFELRTRNSYDDLRHHKAKDTRVEKRIAKKEQAELDKQKEKELKIQQKLQKCRDEAIAGGHVLSNDYLYIDEIISVPIAKDIPVKYSEEDMRAMLQEDE